MVCLAGTGSNDRSTVALAMVELMSCRRLLIGPAITPFMLSRSSSSVGKELLSASRDCMKPSGRVTLLRKSRLTSSEGGLMFTPGMALTPLMTVVRADSAPSSAPPMVLCRPVNVDVSNSLNSLNVCRGGSCVSHFGSSFIDGEIRTPPRTESPRWQGPCCRAQRGRRDRGTWTGTSRR